MTIINQDAVEAEKQQERANREYIKALGDRFKTKVQGKSRGFSVEMSEARFDYIFDGYLHQKKTYVEENELNTSTIQISDGTLKFNKSKQVQGLTMKYVEDCLLDLIEDADKVKDIMKHIKTSREHKYTNEIKRFKKS